MKVNQFLCPRQLRVLRVIVSICLGILIGSWWLSCLTDIDKSQSLRVSLKTRSEIRSKKEERSHSVHKLLMRSDQRGSLRPALYDGWRCQGWQTMILEYNRFGGQNIPSSKFCQLSWSWLPGAILPTSCAVVLLCWYVDETPCRLGFRYSCQRKRKWARASWQPVGMCIV